MAELDEQMTGEKEERQLPPTAQWFALHVLSGQEFNVKKSMLARIKSEELGDVVFDVVIPTERVSEVKRGKKSETERKLYPGYVFVQMSLYDENKTLNDRCWYFSRETPGVIGFADGEKPIPMRASEVEGMLSQMRDKEDKVIPKVAFSIGDKVRVGDGPFQSQEGVVTHIDPDRGVISVEVSIFGRSTPVELEYWQVEKL